jgi:hypothetical protein
MGQTPEAENAERVIETILCCAQVDKEGRILRRFCITVPGPYPPNSGTPATSKEDAASSPANPDPENSRP